MQLKGVISKAMIEKVHGGFKVDGLKLLAANCGCGGSTAPGGVWQ